MSKNPWRGRIDMNSDVFEIEHLSPLDTIASFSESLEAMGVDSKGVWKRIEECRVTLYQQKPWASHFFMPFAQWLKLIMPSLGAFDAKNRKNVGMAYQFVFTQMVLATWRTTKNIYEFEENFVTQLLNTNVNSALSLASTLFLRLPFHCVYLKTPPFPISQFGLDVLSLQNLVMDNLPEVSSKEEASIMFGPHTILCRENMQMRGMYVMLDQHTITQPALVEAEQVYNPLLRQTDTSLVICADTGNFMRIHGAKYPTFEILRIPLGDWTLEQALSSCGVLTNEVVGKTSAKEMASKLMPLLGFVLYLCAANANIRSKTTHQPYKAAPKRLFWGKHDIPHSPRVWEVGERQGAPVRLLQEPAITVASDPAAPSDPAVGGGTPKRPHWRRAHWQSYWVGKGRTELQLKWLEPILVKGDLLTSSLPAVTHAVQVS